MFETEEIFKRTALLMGEDYVTAAQNKRVIVFGVGGVGSWCAEMLVRSGIGHITIVDSDCVAVSNINRQLIATTHTVGQVKVDVLKKRLLEINPRAEVTALQQVYNPETAASFQLETYDYIIDAIDSLSNKVHLLRYASTMPGTTFASMGAALKTDPTRLGVAEFWKVKGCPLAAALRARIKKFGGLQQKIQCVYSDEVRPNRGAAPTAPSDDADAPASQWDAKKARINGTMSYLPAMAGMMLSSLVVQHIDSSLQQ